MSYKGQKIDEKIVAQGKVFTYVEKNIGEESDVPVFVTMVDSIFAGPTSDIVQLRYTWLISRNVTTIKTGDAFGVFEVTSINQTGLTLQLGNPETVNLDQNAVVDLIGEIKFKVADKADVLRLYPKVDYEMAGAAPAVPPTATPTTTPAVAETVATETSSMTPTKTSISAIDTPAQLKLSVESIPKETGFEVVFAILGLLAVVHLILKQKK